MLMSTVKRSIDPMTKQSLMQSPSMSNRDLLNNSTGGDWTTFHAHICMHSLVAAYGVVPWEYVKIKNMVNRIIISLA